MRYWTPREIPGNPRVGIAVATYLTSADCHRAHLLRTLVSCFRAQTYQNWRMRIVHDGPHPHDSAMLAFIEEQIELAAADARVELVETGERKQQFGHPHRQQTVLDLAAQGCEWLLLTNDDNYYVPVFLEWLLAEAVKRDALLVYCDMVHSHKKWRPFPTLARYRYLDLGALMVRTELAKQVPFDKYTFNGDGDWINRLANQARKRVYKVPATLMVHN